MTEHDPSVRHQDRPSDARPSRTPLGRAFLIQPAPLNDDLIRAVRAVASVHGDGPLPAIPIRHDSSLNEVSGRFRFDRNGPISILINPARAHREFAVVHEIGHFLDFSGFGTPNAFASVDSDALRPWRLAVQASARLPELRRVLARRAGSLASEQRADDLSSEPETWARSYAQYVAMRSDEPRLLEALDAIRSARFGDRVDYLLHWDDDDFDPIAEAIEVLFRSLRWRSSE